VGKSSASRRPFPALPRVGRQCHNRLDCSEEAEVEIDTAQLARVAELLDLLDGFLRSGTGVADRLADYLHPPDVTARNRRTGPGNDTNLVIDLVSFTAHALRVHGQGPPR
jgi:hypothetical protein